MLDTKGYIMQLQNFSVNDGDGIRTTIFLSGCPMRCKWCSNPEGQTLKNPLTREISVGEVMKQLERQLLFYRVSAGGVTFSGGEATSQPEFLRALVNEIYNAGIFMAIETCGAFVFEEIEDILLKMDLIFMDLKSIDPKKHKVLTGHELAPILKNIESVAGLKKQMVIRIPVIKGVNADPDHIKKALQFIRDTVPDPKVEFLPYHTFGEEKYRILSMPVPDRNYTTPTENEMETYKQLSCEIGVNVVSYR